MDGARFARFFPGNLEGEVERGVVEGRGGSGRVGEGFFACEGKELAVASSARREEGREDGGKKR